MNLPPNTDLMRAAFAKAQSILLTGPKGPDGDSIGACLALARGMSRLTDATVDVAGVANYRYDWMPGADTLLSDEDVGKDYDLVVVLDGDRTRLTPGVDKAFKAAKVRGIIDHHGSTAATGYDVVTLDGNATSTCEMVAAMLAHWGVPMDPIIATCIYTGVIFDTGGFRHSNTTPATHRLAAVLLEHGVDSSFINAKVLAERTQAGLRMLGDVLANAEFVADGAAVLGQLSLASAEAFGISSGDFEGVISTLLNTTGVELACVVTERKSGQSKLSFRSRTTVNVARLAKSLDPGGGGHIRASGVTLKEPFAAVVARLPEVLAAAIRSPDIPGDEVGASH
jgi:phosphoesterase RecJ-like protein